jgi:hypothetical protein
LTGEPSEQSTQFLEVSKSPRKKGNLRTVRICAGRRVLRVTDILFYLADVSVPLFETSFVETRQVSGARSIVHFILFLLWLYFGFVRKSKA